MVQSGVSLPCKEIELKAVRPYRGVFIDGTRPRLQELINIVFFNKLPHWSAKDSTLVAYKVAASSSDNQIVNISV